MDVKLFVSSSEHAGTEIQNNTKKNYSATNELTQNEMYWVGGWSKRNV